MTTTQTLETKVADLLISQLSAEDILYEQASEIAIRKLSVESVITATVDYLMDWTELPRRPSAVEDGASAILVAAMSFLDRDALYSEMTSRLQTAAEKAIAEQLAEAEEAKAAKEAEEALAAEIAAA